MMVLAMHWCFHILTLVKCLFGSKKTVCCTVTVLSFLFSLRHAAEHVIHPRPEIQKEQFSSANGIGYFSIECKLGIGVCFLWKINKVHSEKLHCEAAPEKLRKWENLRILLM